MPPSSSSSVSFGKRIHPSRLHLLSKNRPPPLKSCLASSDSDRDSHPSGEPCVRKTVHFPDDISLVRVRIIPPRKDRTKKAIFNRGRLAETKSFIMYTSNPFGSTQRFLCRLPGSPGPRYTMYSHWMSVVRARRLAAAYSSQPRPPRSAPSANGPVPEPASDGSLHGSAFDMSSLKHALLEPASGSSLHGSSLDISSLTQALPDPDMAFDISPLMRSLPDPDAPSDASSLAHAPKSMVASHSRESRSLPPKAHVRVVQTLVQVGPFSATRFFSLCGVLLVLGAFFPWLVPASYAAFVLLFIYGTCFF
ncbi:hypothetical protein N7471_006333 [Penicillium samsonianum]|uniref:uncharacterized protein n=1 Tax=Penicillium samsonianum TaxID=1882272 RepID=UPI002546BE7F|nr:uncharacterized protein N7471_006333 [Penicillium samsonianum]KAJ6139847.1 hypothetical protein N7471_006333 [Penicillium samsonianum]